MVAGLIEGVPPLSFGHFPHEWGKPGRTSTPGTLTRRAGEGIKRQGLFFSGFPRARE